MAEATNDSLYHIFLMLAVKELVGMLNESGRAEEVSAELARAGWGVGDGGGYTLTAPTEMALLETVARLSRLFGAEDKAEDLERVAHVFDKPGRWLLDMALKEL